MHQFLLKNLTSNFSLTKRFAFFDLSRQSNDTLYTIEFNKASDKVSDVLHSSNKTVNSLSFSLKDRVCDVTLADNKKF